MATTLTETHSYIWLFAAIRRTERTARPCMLRTVAPTEKAARRLLVRDYVLAFAGRLPVQEAA